MFHGVVVDVIEMAFKVVLVFQGVLPKPRLPDSPSPFMFASFRYERFHRAGVQPAFGELLLNPSPAARVVNVTGWKRPKGVQVIWQPGEGANFKRPSLLAFPQNLSEE